MAKSQWHSFYNAKVAAQPAALFELLSDMPNYRRWLPQSDAFGRPRMSCHTPSNWAVGIMTGNPPSPEKTGGAP